MSSPCTPDSTDGMLICQSNRGSQYVRIRYIGRPTEARIAPCADSKGGSGEKSVVLNVTIPLCSCGNCGLEFTDYRAEDIRNSAVCHHLKLLSPAEILAIRERHGMSQQAFADVSRIGRASLARWECGSIIQNASADSLLYLLGFQDNVDRLKNRFNQSDDERLSGKASNARFRSLSVESAMYYRNEAASFRLYLDA